MPDIQHRLLVRTSPPATEPLSLSDVKSFLRIDGSAEDAVLNLLIATARILAEELTGHALITQSWKIAYDTNVPECVPLVYLPVQSITAVTSINEAEESTTIAASSYTLNAARDALIFESIPSGRRIEILYESGYGDAASDVPADIRQAMLVHVAHLYEHRDSQTPPDAVQGIYAQHRGVRL